MWRQMLLLKRPVALFFISFSGSDVILLTDTTK